MNTPNTVCLASLTLAFISNVYAEPKVDEQIVGPAASDAKYVVSPQGGHLATVGHKGSRMMVSVDGVAGPKVDDIVTPVAIWVDPRPMQAPGTSSLEWVPQPVTFSKDGNHYAYIARLGQEWVLMEDNKEVLRLPGAGLVGGTVGIGGNAGNTDLRLQFGSNDGKHLFFAKSSFAGFELWVDGQKMPGYYFSGGGGTAGTTDPLIFPDGARFAYLAKMGTRPGDPQSLFVDGKDAGYRADNLQATADGHLVGLSRSKDGMKLLVDGKSVFSAREIFAVYVAPVGHRLLAVLRHTNPNGSFGQFLWVDGKPAEATLSEQIRQVVFSPDGKRYAAICGRPGAEFVVVDGKKGQEYQSIDNTLLGMSSGLSFSPDSTRVAYVANAQGKKFIVIDDDESDAYNDVALFRFMPDGHGVVTFGAQGQTKQLSINGKVSSFPLNASPQFESLAWSQDGSHHAFVTGFNQNGGAPVFLDGKDTGLTANRFYFSPDSKHFAVVGYQPSNGKAGIFVDGTLVFAQLQSIGHFAFSPDSQHLFWMSLEPVKNPTTDAFEWVTYADGKPVLHSDRSTASQLLLFPQGYGKFDRLPPAWSVRSDGALHILTATPDGTKHITATASPDTSLATLLQETTKGSDKKSLSAK